jgi:hypothetical protein
MKKLKKIKINLKSLRSLKQANQIVIFWVLALVSIGVIFLLSAKTDTYYKPANQVTITFDHQASINEIQSLTEEFGIVISETDSSESNELKFTSDSEANYEEFLTKIKEIDSVVSASAFQIKPLNLFDYYLPLVAVNLIILAIISVLAVFFYWRKKTTIDKLKIWAIGLSVPIWLSLILAAAGIIVSQTSLILFNAVTFNFYVVSILAFTSVYIYLLINEKSSKYMFDKVFPG